jgi:hypothetical protein
MTDVCGLVVDEKCEGVASCRAMEGTLILTSHRGREERPGRREPYFGSFVEQSKETSAPRLAVLRREKVHNCSFRCSGSVIIHGRGVLCLQ